MGGLGGFKILEVQEEEKLIIGVPGDWKGEAHNPVFEGFKKCSQVTWDHLSLTDWTQKKKKMVVATGYLCPDLNSLDSVINAVTSIILQLQWAIRLRVGGPSNKSCSQNSIHHCSLFYHLAGMMLECKWCSLHTGWLLLGESWDALRNVNVEWHTLYLRTIFLKSDL